MLLSYYLIATAVLSLAALILYFVDKQRAIKKKWRIRESVLLSIGFIGGSVGALAGMMLFRHKTKHWYFWCINFAGLALELILIYLISKSAI